MKKFPFLFLFVIIPAIVLLTSQKPTISLTQSKNSVIKNINYVGLYPNQFTVAIYFTDENESYTQAPVPDIPTIEITVSGKSVITTSNNLHFVTASYSAIPMSSFISINSSMKIEYQCAIWGDTTEEELKEKVIKEVTEKIIHQLKNI
ncbi:MAG: hypothetical protein MUC87_07390 [Bacteroidia bacterium]|jgi:hypothetical protein|nr:hypothetical protein [Bacteroidia bacterium]